MTLKPSHTGVSKHLDGESQLWGIRDFAALFDVTPRTLRFYEDKGLIAPKREAGSRVYKAQDFYRVERIIRGKRLGFSLDELREVFDVADGHVADALELERRKENFEAVIKSLERRHKDLKQTAQEMRVLCDEIDAFIKQQSESGSDNTVFQHAAAYEAAFRQTFNPDSTTPDEDYNFGYPAHVNV